MAETLVAAPVINFVIGKLLSYAWSDLKTMWEVDTRELEKRLSTIHDVLKETQRNSVVIVDNSAVQKWLNKLKDAAYDADDVVHEYHVEALRLLRTRKMENLKEIFSSNKNIMFRRNMNKKLKYVLKALDEIMKDRQWLLLTECNGRRESLDQGRETFSALPESRIYGRDKDKENLVNYLINADNDREVSILAIVGLGGIGKTTLARLVYNDGSINREFDREIWVWVSTDFNVGSILKKIIERITGNSCAVSQIEAMHQRLKGLLRGERFFLVLDDVWTEDEQQWRQLQSLLSLGRKGSKILVTTRCLQVARIMRSTFTYELKGLSNDNCWEIFRDIAFNTGRAEEVASLEEIGKKITNSSGGLPLAAEVLGSLTATLKEEEEWLHVQNTELWRLAEDGTKVLSTLKLSYHLLLPPHLKQCFAYCSLFPKQYKFDKEKFIDLWFAEEFIPSPAHTNCFAMFLDTYFFQDAEQHYNDDVEAYKMHDVVHDLAWSVAGDEFLFVSGDRLTFKKTYQYSSFQYISLICDGLSLDTLNSSPDIDKVRSLILVPGDSNRRCNLSKGNWEKLLKLSLLRVLDLSSTDISELPRAISNLQRLKFLNLSNTDITTLPDTVTGLHNLLMLNLACCRKLQQLPNGLSNMSNLLQLDIYGCHGLTHMPSRIGRLSKLQLLSMFMVGKEDGHTITELQHMNMLSGRLQIKNLHKVTNRNEADLANLKAKTKLRHLELYWDGKCQNAEAVAESLRPHHNLEGLTISGYNGNTFPSWMSEDIQTIPCRMKEVNIVNCKESSLSDWCEVLQHLTTLEKLKISECEELTHLPANLVRQDIPSLKTLDISNNKNLNSLGEGIKGEPPHLFTSIHNLILCNCKSLAELPGWLGCLNSLKSMDIHACTELGSLQQLKALGQCQIMLCPDLARRSKEDSCNDGRMDFIIQATQDNQPNGEEKTNGTKG